jgi:hypothetical protein
VQGSRGHFLTIGALVLLDLLLFGSVLLPSSEHRILSYADSDVASEYVHWRKFGFEELRRGNLALWNPHVFSGTPFFGGFQAALLYPLNAIFLVLPIDLAINWSIALHVLLAGGVVYLWAAYRGMKPLACLLPGAIVMLCGPFFPHVAAGHLSNLCAVPWVFLLLFALEGIFDRGGWGWTFLGIGAVSLLILAGHPQYTYYAAIASFIYIVIRSLRSRPRLTHLGQLALVAIVPLGIAAVQLWAGWQEAKFGIRSAPMGREFASSLSLAPENLITVVAPSFFFGRKDGGQYWGNGYFWEMSLFFGCAVSFLALFGVFAGPGQRRRHAPAMIGILFVLALGANSPLFGILYDYVPGFGRFRGTSKFTTLMVPFVALLAGAGFDRVLELRRIRMRWVVGSVLAGLIFLSGAVFLPQLAASQTTYDRWARWMKVIYSRPLPVDYFVPPPS